MDMTWEAGVDGEERDDYKRHVKKYIEKNFGVSQLDTQPLSVQSIWHSYGFGISQEIKNFPFLYQTDQNEFSSSEKIIFASNNLVGILMTRVGQYRFYTQHKGQVTALCIGQKTMMASAGYRDEQAEILVWNIQSLKTL